MLKSNEAEISSFRQLVRAVVQTRLRTPDDKTLLHLAVLRRIGSVNQPRRALVESLLVAGAAVNVVDSAVNAPLHLAVYNRPADESMRKDWEKRRSSYS